MDPKKPKTKVKKGLKKGTQKDLKSRSNMGQEHPYLCSSGAFTVTHLSRFWHKTDVQYMVHHPWLIAAFTFTHLAPFSMFGAHQQPRHKLSIYGSIMVHHPALLVRSVDRCFHFARASRIRLLRLHFSHKVHEATT